MDRQSLSDWPATSEESPKHSSGRTTTCFSSALVVLRLAFLILFAAFAADSAAAQTVTGTIADEGSATPVTFASVMLVDSVDAVLQLAVTDGEGAFVLEVPRPGTYRVRVEALGYDIVESDPLLLDTSGTVTLPMLVGPQPIELAGLAVTAELRLNPNLEGFLFRQKMGFGRFLGPEDIATMDAFRASDLLRPLIFVERRPRGIIVHSRGRRCRPAVYVDGFRRYDGAAWFDEEIVPALVRAVEVYHNPLHAPDSPFAFEGFDCAVISIWTDVGFGW